MLDRKSPLSLLVEAELKKKGVMRDLRSMAMRLAGSNEADAKDLLAKALVRVIDPDADPWPGGVHPFLAHIYVAMRRIMSRERRRVRLGGEVFDGGFAQENTANDDVRADDEAERSGWLDVRRMLGEQVLARVGPDSLAGQFYKAATKEDLEPAEVAARFHGTIDEVRAAQEQLRYHARIVLAEWNASEERRMKAVREQARTQSEAGTR